MAGGSQEYARLTEKTNEFYAAFAGTALLRIFFKDKDHIHFELQRMEDGVNWKTEMAGDEERVK
jgi:hypothetical protein